jgi:hypothetical protein
MKWTRTRPEIIAKFTEQMSLLDSACAGYDSGHEAQSLWIATCLWTMLYDGKPHKKNRGTTSLLTQLGLRDSLQYVSTGWVPSQHNYAPQMPLISVDMASNRHVPVLCTSGQFLSYGSEVRQLIHFLIWWEKNDVIRVSTESAVFSTLNRRELLFILRSQDGGAHVDETIGNQSYISLSKVPVWMRGEIGRGQPILGAISATARQIGWEFQQTMLRHGEVK